MGDDGALTSSACPPVVPGGDGLPTWLPILLGFLTAVGAASTDMYLPAFPDIERTLHGAPGSAQFTLAAWFAGLAVGQLTQGTLADRFGRRGPLIAGTLLYTVTAAASALAPSIFWLSVLRALSAIGASAGMVIPRAVVRDMAEGHAAAILMSRLMLVMGVAPILAPTLGGMILSVASWRALFWLLTGYGTLCCILVVWLLPETLPPARRVRLGPGEQIARYRQILREPIFASHAAIMGAGAFALFAYIGGASPVFIDGFGLSPTQFGMVFGLCACGLIGGAQSNAHILARFGLSAVLGVTVRVFLAATAVLAAVAFAGVAHLAAVIALLFCVVTCFGFLNPNTTVGALTRHAAHAGAASAVLGTVQFTFGALSGLAVGLLTDGTPRGMAGLMLVGAVAAILADRWRVRAFAASGG